VPQRPCPHRSVSEDGRLTCDKIALGDHEVSPAICDNCPARACDCQHLRFSLEKVTLTPITVRWASGRTEVWDDQPPRVSFLRSACALKKTPVASPAVCLACCSLRQAWAVETLDQPAAHQAVLPLADNVLPFVRSLHREPSLPCTSS
jgi:hypothetical protein